MSANITDNISHDLDHLLRQCCDENAQSGATNGIMSSGLLGAATASGNGNKASIITNSTLIEILVHLLCREREVDTVKREQLFQSFCELIQKWNGSLYVPLHSFTEHQDINGPLERLADFLEKLQGGLGTTASNLIRPPVSGSPLTQLALAESRFVDDRYSREFIEVSTLGKGGFGAVVEAKNLLDNRHYAIKMVVLKDNMQTNRKMLREVQTLAHLSPHPNIVRYHSAWLQSYVMPLKHLPEEDNSYSRQRDIGRDSPGKGKVNFAVGSRVRIQELDSSLKLEEIDDSSFSIVFEENSSSKYELESIKKLHSISAKSNSHFASRRVKICETIKEIADANSDSLEFQEDLVNKDYGMKIDREASWSHLNVTEHSSSSYSSSNKENSSSYEKAVAQCKKRLPKPRMTLFIQMGLCSRTLANWLVHRNEQRHPVDAFEVLQFFRQIVSGVCFIHSKNIIHRDLKPSNIFFMDDGKSLQIGDFGLARFLIDTGHQENSTSSLAPINMFTNNTRGVGTPIYAPPELKFDATYNDKSDIHNLGIILYEMFKTFHTDNERYTLITKLKNNRNIDPEMLQQWPNIASLILQLTSSNQAERPTAKELMDMIIKIDDLLEARYSTICPEAGGHQRCRAFVRQRGGTFTNRNDISSSRFLDLEITTASAVECNNTEIKSISDTLPNNNTVEGIIIAKDEEIRKLRMENEDLRKMVSQLQEQINQSHS